MVTREERDTRQLFADRYGEDRTDVVRQIGGHGRGASLGQESPSGAIGRGSAAAEAAPAATRKP